MALQKLSSKPKTLRGFELSMVIGKGSYGEVWLARHIKDKRPYVLKKINLKSTSDKERRAAEQEARLLSNLKHPNIVTYKDSFQTGERYLYIAMQYCEGGDLYTLLKERKGKVLEEKQVVEWFIQIAMALQQSFGHPKISINTSNYGETNMKHHHLDSYTPRDNLNP
ncbi:serine/threonine-protein kinase Nek4-like [Octopus vulgaris]|uniref:non-specific serine/threonine protein kinase n=1 Tax=Octopus vulgaris TaxID=6645 RepID=A0AA36F0V3_OCTVU|nr:serine/threonine-protein kinase Nek4-like [Octopus vulgaris]